MFSLSASSISALFCDSLSDSTTLEKSGTLSFSLVLAANFSLESTVFSATTSFSTLGRFVWMGLILLEVVTTAFCTFYCSCFAPLPRPALTTTTTGVVGSGTGIFSSTTAVFGDCSASLFTTATDDANKLLLFPCFDLTLLFICDYYYAPVAGLDMVPLNLLVLFLLDDEEVLSKELCCEDTFPCFAVTLYELAVELPPCLLPPVFLTSTISKSILLLFTPSDSRFSSSHEGTSTT